MSLYEEKYSFRTYIQKYVYVYNLQNVSIYAFIDHKATIIIVSRQRTLFYISLLD